MSTLTKAQWLLLDAVASTIARQGTDEDGFISHEAVCTHFPDIPKPALNTLLIMAGQNLIGAQRIVRQKNTKKALLWTPAGDHNHAISYRYSLLHVGIMESWTDTPVFRMPPQRTVTGNTPQDTFYVYRLSLTRRRKPVERRPSLA